MGKVEISIEEEWVLRVVHRYDLRVLLRRLRAEGFGRHRVAKRPNCGCLSKSVQERLSSRVLMFLLLILSVTVISLIILDELLTCERRPDERSTWLFGHFHPGQRGAVLLLALVAVLAAGVLAKKATMRREEVQTVSALVQQV
ncbi:uncharacterized protein LOC143335584 [Chaetodon auriga]|uniref:uncharacterized protein LOC143335584 n=1 Tax=Chaetodon auriga TaxID=39042 RepID=UPI004032B17C